jgi:hypothetical protein
VALATEERQKFPRAAWLALAVLAFLGSTFLLVRSVRHHGTIRSDAPASTAVVADVALPATSTTSASSEPVIEPPKRAASLRTVTIVASPLDATIKRDDIDVGLSPKDISIAAGEVAQVTVSRDGYVTRTISVDGSSPRVEVLLQQRRGDTAPSVSARPKCPPGERFIYQRCMHI